jgi:hypothetical protein
MIDDERRELDEDRIEDLELDDKQAEAIKGGITVNKAKTADKAYAQMDGYVKQ